MFAFILYEYTLIAQRTELLVIDFGNDFQEIGKPIKYVISLFDL